MTRSGVAQRWKYWAKLYWQWRARVGKRVDAPGSTASAHWYGGGRILFPPGFHRLFFFFFPPPIVESVIPLTGNCLARQMFRPNARRWDYRGSFCCAAYIYMYIGLVSGFYLIFLYSSLSFLFFFRVFWLSSGLLETRGDFSIVSINFSDAFLVSDWRFLFSYPERRRVDILCIFILILVSYFIFFWTTS